MREVAKVYRAMTLIETLIITAIVGLVLVVIALGISGVRGELKTRQVWDLLATLDEALTVYQTTTGQWPVTQFDTGEQADGQRIKKRREEDDGAEQIIAALTAVPESRAILEKIPKLLRVTTNNNDWGSVQDAWGYPLRCLTITSQLVVDRQAVAANGGKPIFISLGQDGRFGAHDSLAAADNLRSDELPRQR